MFNSLNKHDRKKNESIPDHIAITIWCICLSTDCSGDIKVFWKINERINSTSYNYENFEQKKPHITNTSHEESVPFSGDNEIPVEREILGYS